jgi:Carboxypeptidase regulatory-like domain
MRILPSLPSLVAEKLNFRFLLVIGFCLFSLQALAQSPQGTIAGTITDISGAAIQNATVTAVSLQTNDTRTATTNNAGAYRIEAVLPGDYKISATANTFGTTTAPSAHVTSSVVTSVNLVLQPGGSAVSVDISAEVELLRTNSGELSNTLNMKEVQTLPIGSLNPYALATTLPGVAMVKTVDLTNGTSFAVNGGRPRDNNFLIEGMDNNDQGIHGQAFQPANTEAVQEVTFLLNSFSGEFGHGGSVSNLIYQSGSNQFHGAVWDRLYNSSLDATDHNDVLNGNPKAKYRENVYGFRIGGPVVKDKAFFFVSTQWDHRRETANLGVLTVPTDAGFAKLQQFASNPRIATLLAAYGNLRGVNQNFARTVPLGPDPNNPIVDRGSVDFAGVQRSLGNQTNSYELIAKGDINISASDKLQLRFIQAPSSTPYDTGNFPDQLPGFDTMQSGNSRNAGLTETHIFSPNFLNELRLNWSRIGFSFDLRPETSSNPLSVLPSVSISNITGYGIPAGSVPQGRFQNTYTLQDAVSLTRGSHFIKVGFDVSDIRVRDQAPFNFYGSIPYTNQLSGAGYSALANYMDDFGGTDSALASINYGNPVARPEIWSQNYYAQDTWKLRPNLSVDFGARYEYNGAPFNYLGYPAFNANNPACFLCSVKQIPDKNNIAPRLGFNWSPIPNGKTVISGGFGLFYSHIFTNIIDNIQTSAPNAASKQVRSAASGRGTGNWSGVLTRITDKSPLPGDTANVIASNLVDPENYQWNLRIQRELPGSFVFSAAYVGNRGVHQYATTEFNPFIAGTTDRVVGTRGRIIREDNTNDSMYHAGQFTVEHKLRQGLTFRGAYTYSKALDTGSELFTPSDGNWSTYAERQYPNPRGLEWGPSAFDLRHVFSMTYLYNPPTWHAEGFAKAAAAVVNGWTFAGITSVYSGSPVNVEIGYDWNGDGISNDRPMLANPKAPLNTWAVRGDDPNLWTEPTAGYCDGAAYWNTADNCHPVTLDQVHWVTASLYTQGKDVSRNSTYGKTNQQWDMSIQRTFKLLEKHAIDFRAESFNVFNHALTNQPGFAVKSTLTTDAINNPAYGNNTFLDYGLTNSGGRQLRFLLKYSF